MTIIKIPQEKIKIANNVMICRCSVCKKRIRPQERYLDEEYFGWNTEVHVDCWLNYRPYAYRGNEIRDSLKALKRQ